MRTKLIFYFSLLIFITTIIHGCYYDEEIIYEGLPQNVSLKNDVTPIFTRNCSITGCHDAVPAHAPSLVPENAYNALLNGGYINTIDPVNSTIYREVASGNMPPSGPISVNDQKIILAWITEGAQDN